MLKREFNWNFKFGTTLKHYKYKNQTFVGKNVDEFKNPVVFQQDGASPHNDASRELVKSDITRPVPVY